MVLGILRQYRIIYLGHMVFRILEENLLHSPTALCLPHIVALLGQFCKEYGGIMTNESINKAVLQNEHEFGLSLNPDPIPDLGFYDQNFKNMCS